MESTPGPKYSTIAPVPPFTVKMPATLRMTSVEKKTKKQKQKQSLNINLDHKLIFYVLLLGNHTDHKINTEEK